MKRCFCTQAGPKAVGPYSSAVIHGNTAYFSGVIPIVPQTGKLAEGGIQQQTQQVLDNLAAMLNEMELSFQNVVKTTVYLTDLKNFAAVNEMYGKVFGPDYPARSCVEVSALPMGAQIEIEIIAAC